MPWSCRAGGAGVCLALVRGSLVAGCLTAAAAALVRWLLVWLQGATYTGGARLDGKVGAAALSISIHWGFYFHRVQGGRGDWR